MLEEGKYDSRIRQPNAKIRWSSLGALNQVSCGVEFRAKVDPFTFVVDFIDSLFSFTSPFSALVFRAALKNTSGGSLMIWQSMFSASFLIQIKCPLSG